MPTGLKSWKKCIAAILEMCIGYWLMWSKQAHLLKPLSDKSYDNLLLDPRNGYYIYFHENHVGCWCFHGIPKPQNSFTFYIKALDYRMGAVVIKQKPSSVLTLWIDQAARKLTCHGQRTPLHHHGPEEFYFMLLVAELFNYTDHKNLDFANLNCCHVLCWLFFVKEYDLAILYQPSKKNVIANKL